MSGFAVLLRHGDTVLAEKEAGILAQALAPFGADRRASGTAPGLAHAWVIDAGFTPQDPFERQPVELNDDALVFLIGRLHYRDELGVALSISPSELSKMPDCKLAALAWRKWRMDCRKYLYGGYTMLVVEPQSQRCVAIRSHERSPHLYCYRDRDRTVFATSTKAIFALPGIEKALDDAKLADTLVLNYHDAQRSYFRNVSIVPQGHDCICEPSAALRLVAHDLFESAQSVRFANDSDYVEEAQRLLDAALGNVFRSNHAPAISLSAGLDSTTLAVSLIEQMRARGDGGPGSLKAYVVIPNGDTQDLQRPGRLTDEGEPVRDLMAMYPELDVAFVSPDYATFDQGLDMIQSFADMPLHGVANLAWGDALYRQARADGHKLVVSGGGGNGTISMRAAQILFAKWLGQGRWLHCAKEMRAFARLNLSFPLRRHIAEAAITNMPDAIYDAYYRWRGDNRWKGHERYSAINPEFAADIGATSRMQEFGWDERFRRKPDRQAIMRKLVQEGVFNEGGGLLEAGKVMTGVEGCDPLSDRRLMEFCYAIPDDQFYKDGIDRRLVKRMMAGKLPDSVTYAQRGDQGSDWHRQITRDIDRISEELDRAADIPSIASRIDVPRMQKIVREWPDKAPTSYADYPDYALARYGIGRALSVARFINQVEGRN